MTEPTSTASGSIGLAALMIAVFGPAAGEYATIVFAALAGALWPLSSRGDLSRREGAVVVLRLVLTSAALTGALAWWVERSWGVPATTILAPCAFVIAAFGDHWTALIAELAKRFKTFIRGAP